jgi:NitT/TauT family transport system substrate-binding protein
MNTPATPTQAVPGWPGRGTCWAWTAWAAWQPWRWLAALGLLCALVACQPRALTEPWRIAVSLWVGYEPLVLAQETGTLPPAMRVVELASNTESKRAFRNGLVELAALTLDEALRLADEGVALHIVAVLSDSAGADAVLAQPGVAARLAVARAPDQASDQPPLRIGLERTALGELLLAHWLLKMGLTQADVKLLHMEANDHENALRRDAVDLLVTFEPIKTRLVQRGAVNLLDTRELPGAVVDVLVARPGLDTERLAALLQAWQPAQQSLSASAVPPWMAAALDLSPNEYQQALQGLRFLSLTEMQQRLQATPGTDGAAAALARQSEAMGRILQNMALIRQPPDWPRLLNPAPLLRALQGPVARAAVLPVGTAIPATPAAAVQTAKNTP